MLTTDYPYVEGDINKHSESSNSRLIVVTMMFALAFVLLSVRLFNVALFGHTEAGGSRILHQDNYFYNRLDIVDRNGVLLATNLQTASLYANPQDIIDAGDASSRLHRIFPELNEVKLLRKLRSKKQFVWIKRNLTPKEQYAIIKEGIPGISFQKEEQRAYPHGSLFSHALGYVGIDGHGLSGIEKQFDRTLRVEKNDRPKEPLQLALDTRVQGIVHEELSKAIQEFSAIGGTGIVMDATNGEVISMVSLPDFDPHQPGKATDSQRFNQATYGVYEMGSLFKVFTMAMALESGTIELDDVYDVKDPIRVANFTIRDTHPKGKWLSVSEILMHSSNIGTAHIALDVGVDIQRYFIEILGLMRPVDIEIPEKSSPLLPKKWHDVHAMTISYGHGIAVTPLHIVKALAAVVNGGKLYPTTLLRHDPKKPQSSINVISEETSRKIRQMMRLVVKHGTGRKSEVKGYMVGGKTGTAEKSQQGAYNEKSMLSSFVGVFPMQNPKFVVLAMLDEPQGTKKTFGYATGGMTAAPIVQKIIARMGPLFGVYPIQEDTQEVNDKFWVHYKPNGKEFAAK